MKRNRQKVQDRKVQKRKGSEEGFKPLQHDYDMSWFHPTEAQMDIIRSMCVNTLTVVDASSGCGKSTTVIFQSLQELKRGNFKHILIVKSATETADDPIGFLSGDKNQKLQAHHETQRSIFRQFMTKEKLEMEEKRERITFEIPNYMTGRTYDDTLILIDEAQLNSPNMVKLMTERVGKNSKVVLMGDSNQCYASKRRDNGFEDFINRITHNDGYGVVSKEPLMGYVKLPVSENMRSDLSRRIVELYEIK